MAKLTKLEIIGLVAKGVKFSEIKEINSMINDEETPEGNDVKQSPEEVTEDSDSQNAQDDITGNESVNDTAVEVDALKKQIEELRTQLETAQKHNTNQNVGGKTDEINADDILDSFLK